MLNGVNWVWLGKSGENWEVEVNLESEIGAIKLALIVERYLSLIELKFGEKLNAASTGPGVHDSGSGNFEATSWNWLNW